MSYLDRSEGGRWTVGGLVAAVVGIGLAQFLGTSIVIPLVGAGAAFAVQTKLLDVHGPRAIAVAGLAGHTLWMLLGILLAGGPAEGIWDIVIQLALIAWLLARSSTAAAVITILFEIAAAAVNFWMLNGDLAVDRPLYVHLLLRAVIVATAIWMIVENFRPKRSAEAENERLEEIYR